MRGAQSQRLFRGAGYHVAVAFGHCPRYDDVAAVFQRPYGEREPCVAPHYDGVACGYGLEPPEVVGEMPREAVATAYAVVVVDCYNDGNHVFTLCQSLRPPRNIIM